MGAMSTSSLPPRDAQVEWFLDQADRPSESVPVRRVFVQQGEQAHPVPGPLHMMLRHGDEKALDLYLLFLNGASAEPWDTARDARIWARGLGLPTAKDDGASTVSKVWRRLDATYNLIERHRSGRLVNITALHESGDRSAYEHPSGENDDLYFRLPWAYWLDPERYYRTLSLKAKVMLLVASSLKPGFALPLDKIHPWYGISKRSGADGLQELEDAGLLDRTKAKRVDLGAPKGYVIENRHTLLAPLEQTWGAKNAAAAAGANVIALPVQTGAGA